MNTNTTANVEQHDTSPHQTVTRRPRRVRAMVVAVPADTNEWNEEMEIRFRPSDLLPWSDPYIAGLVHKLQSEIRDEQADRIAAQPIHDEAEIPWDEPFEYENEFSIEPEALLAQR